MSVRANGNKTRFGLAVSSLYVLLGEAVKATDENAATTVDMGAVISAGLVFVGAVHAIWKDWRKPAGASAEGGK